MSIAFRDLPVYDLTGATRNFEQLTAGTLFKPGAPEAQVTRAVNTEFEPSATKDALVLLQLNSKAAEVETNVSLKVGGIQVGSVVFPKVAAELQVQTVTIPVLAGKKWEAKVNAGALSQLQSSYTFLD